MVTDGFSEFSVKVEFGFKSVKRVSHLRKVDCLVILLSKEMYHVEISYFAAKLCKVCVVQVPDIY